MKFVIRFFCAFLIFTACVEADSPSFIPIAVKPTSKNIDHESWYEATNEGPLNKLASGLSQAIKLPAEKYIFIMTQECGQTNAYYTVNEGSRAVVICYEMLEEIEKVIDARIKADWVKLGNVPPEVRDKLWTGAFTFILMHEVGHALIHVLDLPVLGREEDAADQIGAYFLLAMTPPAPAGKQSAFLTGALWFWEPKQILYTKTDFSDEHSVNPQRQANLACWAYGKDPDRFQFTVKYMTKARAVRCAAEYIQLKASVHKLLGKNVQLPD